MSLAGFTVYQTAKRNIMEYTQSNMPKLIETYLLLRRSLTDTRTQAERAHKTFRQIVDEFQLTNRRILEIGAGSRGALLQMFDEKNDVIGIDKYLGAFYQGYWKALKTTLRKMIFDPFFYYHLKKCNGGYLNRNRKIILMDAMKMDFADEEFDFVYSRFVLEHIQDVKKLVEEIYRVLRQGGKTYHVFDLYTSLGGAHTLDWQRYEPWQHLTGHVDSSAYVNKYRLEHYKEAFECVFRRENVVIRTKMHQSWKKYLTPKLRKQLRAYSEEELLTIAPVIIAKKAK